MPKQPTAASPRRPKPSPWQFLLARLDQRLRHARATNNNQAINEIRALVAVLQAHSEPNHWCTGPGSLNVIQEAWVCYTVRTLLRPYCHHPDWNPEWQSADKVKEIA